MLPANSLTHALRATQHFPRIAVAVIVFWIGVMKFFAFEAEGIKPLVANSPLLRFSYSIVTVRQFSTLIGVIECCVAALLILGIWSPRAGFVCGFLAIAMFATSLSFAITTPGAWATPEGGFPLVGELAGFLIKDLALLAISVRVFLEAAASAR